MGLVHRVRTEYADGRYLIENSYTGERTLVWVDRDKEHLHHSTGIFETYPDACPFLRFDPAAKAYCTVHSGRPSICRDFQCWRVLILDRKGTRMGRIIFRETLMTDDAGVRAVWEKYRQKIPDIDQDPGDRELARVFTEAGYVVRV